MNTKLIAVVKDWMNRHDDELTRGAYGELYKILYEVSHEDEQGADKGEQGFDRQQAKQFICGLLAQLFKTDGDERTNCEYNLAIDDAIEAVLFHFPVTKSACSCGKTEVFHNLHGHIQCSACGKARCSHPTPTKPTEPLAVLADRKGYVITRIDGKSEGEYKWAIGIIEQDEEGIEGNWKGFEAPTYAAAEQAAREYLNKLEDRP